MEMYIELAVYFLILSFLGVGAYKLWLTSRRLDQKPSSTRFNLVALFICYIAAIISITVIPSERFSLNTTIPLTNYVPVLNTYKRYVLVHWVENYHGIKNFWQNFIGNIVLFMPLGVFLRLLFGRKVLSVFLIAFLASFFIESIQYASRFFGYYRHIDIDDVILNTFGAVAGFVCLGIYNRLLPGQKISVA